MALIKNKAAPVFDRDQVHKGDMIRAKHQTWDEHRNGVVVSVKEEKLIALYYAGYGNVTDHFTMLASEVSRCEWNGLITADMENIFSITDADGEAGQEVDEQ